MLAKFGAISVVLVTKLAVFFEKNTLAFVAKIHRVD
jgi:hypothetical protein